MTQAEFRQDPKTQSAILHQITVMGEAVKRLSLAFLAQHPDIPWRQIAGMRDFLIHADNSVDLDTVWQVTGGIFQIYSAYCRNYAPARLSSEALFSP